MSDILPRDNAACFAWAVWWAGVDYAAPSNLKSEVFAARYRNRPKARLLDVLEIRSSCRSQTPAPDLL